MNARTIENKEDKLHLKLIKNKSKRENATMKKLKINTVMPKFSFKNAKGKIEFPQNFNLL